MLYPELFKQLESVRWDMDKDIPWASFDASQLSDEQAQTIKMNAITEWSALPATEMFLQRRAEQAVELDDLGFGSHALAVRRVGDDQPGQRIRRARLRQVLRCKADPVDAITEAQAHENSRPRGDRKYVGGVNTLSRAIWCARCGGSRPPPDRA